MSLLLSMERKKKIAFILLSIVLIIFILCPLMQHLTCKETDQGFSEYVLEKMIGFQRQRICTTVYGTMMSVLKNVFLALSGLVIGYAAGNSQKEPEKCVSRSIHNLSNLNVSRWNASDEFLEMNVHESQIVKRDIF